MKGGLVVKRFLIMCASVVFSFLLLTSCLKQQIRVTEKDKPAAGGEISGAEPRVETPADKPAEPSGTPESRIQEADVIPEKDRLAKIEEQKAEPVPRSEIQAFETELIYFDFDKADLSPDARLILEKKAKWLQRYSQLSLLIEGHCDERGNTGYNLALGERRAVAAEKYLILLGISQDRISTLSYGEEKPTVPGTGEEVWVKNRRAEFKLIKNR